MTYRKENSNFRLRFLFPAQKVFAVALNFVKQFDKSEDNPGVGLSFFKKIL
jgi:hypothetical protein